MNKLYVTADIVGLETGGGLVTKNEFLAMSSMGEPPCCLDWNNLNSLSHGESEPWRYDLALLRHHVTTRMGKGDLVHFYAGTFSKTVDALKRQGCKISYTVAAHDVRVSRQAHIDLGMDYDKFYPHMVQPDLFREYIRGYLEADLLICPSEHSKKVLIAQGAKSERIKVIPHGVDTPKEALKPYPEKFTLGYMGAVGPDKGLRYLLEAWKKLDYKDAELVLAGRDSNSPFVTSLINAFGGGNIRRLGWVDNISDFYQNISCYVQPSVSEGFGCEVLEAMVYGRPVICSTGAGACDLVPVLYTYDASDVKELCEKIDVIKTGMKSPSNVFDPVEEWHKLAMNYTWDKIQSRYVSVWKELLS